jgi:hypothetical protein
MTILPGFGVFFAGSHAESFYFPEEACMGLDHKILETSKNLAKPQLKRLALTTGVLSLLLLMTGCGIGDIANSITNSTAQAVDQMNNAINAMANANADWETIVKNLENSLPTTIDQTIKTEISQTLLRAESTAGTEFKCGADFVADRVREHLLRIKAELLKQTPPPVEPTFCNVVPLALDMNLPPERRNLIEIFGYDMDTANVQVLVQNGAAFSDLSSRLARPTHYQLTLDLGGTPNPLSASSQKLILKWNDTEISSISIVQPTTPVCQSEVFKAPQPADASWNPPHIAGDTEFGGDGPDVTARVTLAIQGSGAGNSVTASIYMDARETRSDWTEAAGTTVRTLYTAPPDKKIEKIVGPLVSSYHYVDSNTTTDGPFGGASGEPVSQWLFTGDGPNSDDAGAYTGVKVSFNPLSVVQTETTNCISPTSLLLLQGTQFLSPVTNTRFQPDLKKIDPGIIKIFPIQPIRP